MACKRPITEQTIVDYVLGNVPTKKAMEVSTHLAECESCQQTFKHWQSMLLSDKEQFSTPSPLLKEKIWDSLETKRKEGMSLSSKKVFSIAAMAAIVCLFVGLFYYNQNNSEEGSVHIAQYNEANIRDFQGKPDTQQLNIIPVSNREKVEGNIWINQMTDQMFLEVDGLRPLNDQDYQLWILYNNDDIQHKVMPIEDGSTRILIQGEDFSRLKRIKASIEPKGGSIVQTGPDTFIVEVKY
ncbi:hypothetical protein ACA30_00965 [Virgibacillus soli]|uniref:Anti-sigma factor n=1 Tax=Lederbergia galactosidilytica TaxID=217031 RepID=A0A0Q9XXA8_9BACI|nr:hypothetical protein [Lederbergia galactosidilytica]KRG11849.1 hypothetical protein ACA29_13990 [Lederbergia galactosidilytica]KRG16317.1 hypothetical protein ACA30_00965 [Virgibacillus soli]MBP1915112.1 anti-sigma-K factor RskA [Lederbergia galactosidilytica]